jgi:ZIP family zinc transporter
VENTFWTGLGTSLVAAGVTSLGIYTIRRFSDWGHRNTTYFMCFAAGVLISASFLHMIPKALSMNANAPAWLPRAEREQKKFSLVALGGGVLVAVIVVMSRA